MSADTRNAWEALLLVGQRNALGMWFATDSRDRRWQLWRMNPRSLWTPLLWGRGSFVRSCTMCTFTLNLQWRQPLLHPGVRVWGLTIYGNQFPKASWDGRATFGEESPIRIAAIEKHLQFRQRQQHILDYMSIRNGPGYDQHFHLVCRAEVNISMEKRLQFRYRVSATIQQLMSTYIQEKTTINTFTSFVKRKIASPRRSVSNFESPLYSMVCQFRHNTDRYWTKRASATEQPAMSCCVWKGNDDQHFHFVCRTDDNIASAKSLLFGYWQTHLCIRMYISATVQQVVRTCVQREMTIFGFVCPADVNITMELHLQFQHWQLNPWFGLRGCIWESTTFKLGS